MTAKRIIKNASGYHSKGSTHKEKVHNFALFIKDFDWTGKWHEDADSEILHLRATRGDNERIDIEWPNDQWWPDVWYTYACDTMKCRNISHAAKLAQELPDVERMRRAVGRRRTAARNGISQGPSGAVRRPRVGSGLPTDPGPETPGEALIGLLSTSVPWDKEATEAEVKVGLTQHRNPTVTWVNRMTGAVHSAMIKSGNRHNRISTTKDGKVVITFADSYGFHSIYANSIIGVN